MQKGRKVDGCCRAWGVLLGAISMYKAWSFSKKKEAGRQQVGKDKKPNNHQKTTRIITNS